MLVSPSGWGWVGGAVIVEVLDEGIANSEKIMNF